MKELSIEEKAKRYDETIERLKDLKFAYRFSPEDIFPELKESEDEKIREAIIKIINHYVYSSNTLKPKMLAWLEKQGTPAKLNEEEQNRFTKGVLTSCAMSFIDYLDAHNYEGKICK